jgi:hypothetical protein
MPSRSIPRQSQTLSTATSISHDFAHGSSLICSPAPSPNPSSAPPLMPSRSIPRQSQTLSTATSISRDFAHGSSLICSPAPNTRPPRLILRASSLFSSPAPSSDQAPSNDHIRRSFSCSTPRSASRLPRDTSNTDPRRYRLAARSTYGTSSCLLPISCPSRSSTIQCSVFRSFSSSVIFPLPQCYSVTIFQLLSVDSRSNSDLVFNDVYISATRGYQTKRVCTKASECVKECGKGNQQVRKMSGTKQRMIRRANDDRRGY